MPGPRKKNSSKQTPQRIKCSLCQKLKNSFEVVTPFKRLSGSAQAIAKKIHTAVEDDNLLCNACRIKLTKKCKDSDYTPKKDKKKNREPCCITSCSLSSNHDLLLKSDHDKEHFNSFFDQETNDSNPLCKKHYNDFSNFRSTDSCKSCQCKLLAGEGRGLRKYEIQHQHITVYRESRSENENIDVGDVYVAHVSDR